MYAEMLALQYATLQSAVRWVKMTLLFWILAVGAGSSVAWEEDSILILQQIN